MDDIKRRTERIVESILENERLTADLADDAAQVLLDWGISWATMIVRDSAALDDSTAEEAMYPRLKATRRLMRTVNKWVRQQQAADISGSTTSVTKIIKQATLIYEAAQTPLSASGVTPLSASGVTPPSASGVTSPSEDGVRIFVQQQAEFADNPPHLIANLRIWLEKSITN